MALQRTDSVASTASDDTLASTTAATTDLPVHNDAGLASILPAKIDDPNFDVDDYITELLATANLKTVLRTEAQLVSEIKNLDGERKALVYDNYSKLIKATGTIGDVRRSMESGPKIVTAGGVGPSGIALKIGIPGFDLPKGTGSLDDLEKLKPSIERIGRLATELTGRDDQKIDARAQTARRKDRATMRAQRQKREVVRWALDAPRRFEEMTAQGNRDQVAEEWELLQTMLDKWDGVKGVQELKVECSKWAGPASQAQDVQPERTVDGYPAAEDQNDPD